MSDAVPAPLATYRLQFNRDFRFAHAQTLAPYFGRLGVTHVYASPVLRARQGSMHGYDVTDCATINPQLGDKSDLRSLAAALHTYGMGLVVDIVPNHMAASVENPYWRDVLTYGSCSPFARWFDIDWRLPDRAMWGRVLVPVLGEPRRRVLEDGQIRLIWVEGRFLLTYFEHHFPIDPATIPMICQFAMRDLRERLREDDSLLGQIKDIVKHLQGLPKLAARQRRHVRVDREDTEQQLARFAQIVVQSPRVEQWVEATTAAFGEGEEGRRRLEKLLDAQPYRLVHWRDAARAINYRRFFDINELISIRQEDPQVFDETHAAVLRWIEDGTVDGLRIDHVDGLRDPLGYLCRLRDKCREAERPVPVFVEKILARHETLPRSWPVEGTTGYEFLNEAEALFVARDGFAFITEHYRRALRRPVSFEKIATAGKRRVLRHDLSPHVGRLADILLRLYESSAKTATAAEEQLVAASHAVGTASAAFDDAATAATHGSPVALPWERREFSSRELSDAIVEVIVALPVYRTYVDGKHRTLDDADRRSVEAAIAAARQSGRAANDAIDFLAQVLLLEGRAELSDHDLDERVAFIQRFQQLTGPAAAKGIEDTALYAYVPLVSLNEVGGEPLLPEGDAVETLHKANALRAAEWPRTMLCVSTHDTKRTADVRARLDVLSELPKFWTGLLARWQRINLPLRKLAGNVRSPDTAAEFLCYQTIAGIWPTPDPLHPQTLPDAETLERLRERVAAYMLKAVREAKTYTSWTHNDQAYEAALAAFVDGLFTVGEGGSSFLTDMQKLVSRICRPGFWNSVSRTLIQFTSPGTPDLYQGDELWNFALVDPDNRRPVDFEQRQALLQDVVTGIDADADARRAFIRSIVESPEDGRVKLHTIRSALTARRTLPALFARGSYAPLSATGSRGDHLFAFARTSIVDDSGVMTGNSGGGNSNSGNGGGGNGSAGGVGLTDHAAIVVAPRLVASFSADGLAPPIGRESWGDTVVELPPALRGRSWKCLLTGETLATDDSATLPVGDLLASFPAALLVSSAKRPSVA